MRTSVVGAGSWGTALAVILARNGSSVRLLAHTPEQAEELAARRENLVHLPGVCLPEGVQPAWMGLPPEPCELAVIASPSSHVREACASQMVEGACAAERIVVASKGLEPGGGILTEAAREALGGAEIAALSGPNLARELAAGVPSVAVAASRSRQLALDVRQAFMGPSFRVYVTDDVIGVELAGALKNVMAIAAGMSDGLGYGANTKAALLARGLSEMARIGVACGARIETFMGLAGVGDLFATASSDLSRNYRLGRGLAEGLTLAQALERIGQVAEGAPAAEAAVALAHSHGLPAPICTAVWSVIRGEIAAKACVGRLMERTTLYENVGFGDPPFGGFEDA